MDGTTSNSTLSLCLANADSLPPDPLLNVAQERDLSNVVVVVVENGLSQCWSSVPAALIFKPPDPDPNTSVSGTQCHVTGPGSGLRQGEGLLCSRLIRFHRTPPNYQSVGLYTQPSVYVCILCGCRVRTSVWGSECENQ